MVELQRLADVAMAAVRRRDPTGLPLPGASAMISGDRFVAIGPDEWLVLAPDVDCSTLNERLDWLGGVVVDVSGNRVRYRVSGKDALAFLAAGCAVDLARFQPGDAVSTLLARAQVVIIAEETGVFLVLPRRSFTAYFELWSQSVIASLSAPTAS